MRGGGRLALISSVQYIARDSLAPAHSRKQTGVIKAHAFLALHHFPYMECLVKQNLAFFVVGDILDEYDEDDSTFRTQKDNSVIIDALAYLEDVAEELGIDFGKVEFETLNGYLTNLLGHIPTEDDLDKEIVVNGYRFRILSLGNKTIGKVRAEKIKKEPKGEDKKCQDIQNSQT